MNCKSSTRQRQGNMAIQRSSRRRVRYAPLLKAAILSSPQKCLPLHQIYRWLERYSPKLFPPMPALAASWRNTVRHVLSSKEAFQCIQPPALSSQRLPLNARCHRVWTVHQVCDIHEVCEGEVARLVEDNEPLSLLHACTGHVEPSTFHPCRQLTEDNLGRQCDHAKPPVIDPHLEIQPGPSQSLLPSSTNGWTSFWPRSRH